MRRSDREIKARQTLLALLEDGEVMHLGLSCAGKPYVVPLHYGWEELDGQLLVYFHAAPEGKKMDCIRENPACFVCITGGMQVVQAAEACGWSAAYASLMMEGTISILSDEFQKTKGLDALMRHYRYRGKPDYSEQTLQKTCVCCIAVHTISGKSKP